MCCIRTWKPCLCLAGQVVGHALLSANSSSVILNDCVLTDVVCLWCKVINSQTHRFTCGLQFYHIQLRVSIQNFALTDRMHGQCLLATLSRPYIVHVFVIFMLSVCRHIVQTLLSDFIAFINHSIRLIAPWLWEHWTFHCWTSYVNIIIVVNWFI